MRKALPIVTFFLATPAAAQEVSADQALETYRTTVAEATRPCPGPAPGDDEDAAIVVCGRQQDDRYRAPLYATRNPDAASRAGGEQRGALAADSNGCTTVGRNQSCGHVDFLGMALMALRRTITAIRERD